jgi:PAS domain S-box-containing protein
MNSHQLSKIVFRHFVEICAGGAGILSLISWVGWHVQYLKVSAFGTEYVPMAPSTAWAMILLCCCLYVFNKHSTNSSARYYCYAATLGVGTISLVIGSQFLLGFEIPLERWITPAAPQMGNHPIGRMSPLTAAAFLCAVFAILLEMPPFDRRWFTKQITSFSSLLVFLIGISVILSYVWGTPLLYHSQTIPMALPTAIAFVFLGMGIFYTAWRKNSDFCPKTKSRGNSLPIIDGATYSQIVVRDITERKLIENQLRQSVERQRLYFEQSSLAVIEWNPTFCVERWNPAAERIFGYKAEEAIGQYATFMVPPDDQDEVKRLLMNLAVKQDSLASTNKNQTKDGRTIICRWNNTPLADTEGKFIGAVSICEEITEHKMLEDELERLAAVVRNCNELVSIATPEGKMIFLNEPGCKMLGIEQYNVSRHFLAEFVADDLRETVENMILPALLQGETWKGELKYRNLKTNKFFDAQTTFFGIRDPLSQKPLYLANISLDITERKRVEAALHEKDRKLQLFAENVSDFIWTINFSGKATFVSPSVKQLLGYEPEEFRRFTFKDYLTPASAQFALNRLEKAVAMMRPGQILESDTFEAEYRRKDGSLLWTEVHCNGMYDEKGVLIGVQGITRDISKRKQAEELLKASERRHRLFAENANAILWEMDFSGRYTYLSPSIKRQLGYSPEEGLQFEFGQTMTNSSAESARQFLAEAIDAYQNGRPIAKGYYEGEYYRKDGSKVWMGVHYSAMHDEAGKAIGMQGVAIDISDKKRIEAELMFKNVLLRTQQEVSIDGILAADGDNKVILRNQRFNEMWQMPPDISVTEDDMAVLHTGLAIVAEPEAFLERVLYLYDHRTEKSRDEVVMKDGRVLDRYSAPMFGPDDQYYGRVWFFRDVTDRKQAEETLRKSEELYRKFFENMTDGYPKHDFDPMIPHQI